jgi:hypothetical protein
VEGNLVSLPFELPFPSIRVVLGKMINYSTGKNFLVHVTNTHLHKTLSEALSIVT